MTEIKHEIQTFHDAELSDEFPEVKDEFPVEKVECVEEDALLFEGLLKDKEFLLRKYFTFQMDSTILYLSFYGFASVSQYTNIFSPFFLN